MVPLDDYYVAVNMFVIENNTDDDIPYLLCASTALIIHGANEDHQQNIAQRRLWRGHLCHPQLLPDP